jgi:hypothetical protein
MRNAAYRQRQAARYGAAGTDSERLAVAFDWVRSSLNLLARRRVPDGESQIAQADRAVRLAGQIAEQLRGWAERIDRGDYDTRKRDVS